MKPLILIADDHKLFNDGLKQILCDDFKISGQVFDGRDVLPAVLEKTPNLILLDINLPNIKGLELAKELKLSFPNLKVVFITMYSEDAFVKAAKDLDVDGYILKESESDFLVCSLKKVLAGNTIFDPKLNVPLQNLHHEDYFVKEFSLSKREVEIIGLLKNGDSATSIAKSLNVSFETIKSHKKNIYLKLGINKLSELIKFGIEKGL